MHTSTTVGEGEEIWSTYMLLRFVFRVMDVRYNYQNLAIHAVSS